MFINKKILVLGVILIALSCNKDDSDGFVKPFNNTFTCKVNGEHWEPIRYLPWNPAGYNTITKFSFENNGYKNKGDFGLFSMKAVKHPNPDDPIENTYHSHQSISFATNEEQCFNNIPFSWNLGNLPNCAEVVFNNGFYDKNYIKEYDQVGFPNDINDIIIYSNIIEGEFYLDSIISLDSELNIDLDHGGKDEVWGRFWFTATNKLGDTVRITEGQFHLQE